MSNGSNTIPNIQGGKDEGFASAGTRERNIGLELVRVTEAAAYAAGRLMGRGDKDAVDQAAVDAMRQAVDGADMRGALARSHRWLRRT